MKKRILMIGYNYHPEPTGIGKYSGEMIGWLASQGHECTVVTSYPYYPYWKVQEPYAANRYWYKTEKMVMESEREIEVHRCPQYVPAQPSGLKRALLDFTFTLTAFLKILQLAFQTKYDVVITVVPSFQIGLLGVLYKKLRHARFIYHIQDLQIEAARDLGMIKSGRVLNTLFSLERYILNQADTISSISKGMIRKLQSKAQKDVFLFPNWVDTKAFRPLPDKMLLRKEFGFASSDKVILYSGAIGEKQGLESILYAARELAGQKQLKFLICGSGPYKKKLQELARELELTNVFFFPLQPLERFNQFLNMADLHLVIQKANACDLVMPSKLTTILAVGGLALVTANKGSGLHSLMAEHNMGVLVEAENQQALTEGIREAITGNKEAITQNARSFAKSQLSIDRIMQAFEEAVVMQEELVLKKAGLEVKLT